MIEPTTALAFSVYENRGVYALLLGSGLSRSAEIPTGWEITLDLIRRLGSLEGADEQADWEKWYREKYGKDANYSELLDEVATSPDERRSVLHSYIEPTTEERSAGIKVPTRAHRSIAKLVSNGFIRVIITTNFDRLIENALHEEGVEPTIVKSDDDLAGAVPLIHSRCYVVKVNGDYLDTRIKNTEEELSTYTANMNVLLDKIMDEHGIVVCGWSGEWDEALRAAIQRAPARRYPFFWAKRGQLSQVASDLIEHRRGRTIDIEDADSFFETLQKQIETQAAIQSPNPQSTELLLTSAKRFLQKQENRIDLEELLGGEFRALVEQLGNRSFTPEGNWSAEEFRLRVTKYESATERIARLFGVLGSWGQGAEVKTVTEILQEIGTKKPVGGNSNWINLHSYPAVLLLFAYGLGLLKAGRHVELFGWLATSVRIDGEAKTVASCYLPGKWSGGGPLEWRKLEGLDQRKTPLSDHLVKVFREWSQDYFLGGPNFTTLFETFEILAGLAFLTLHVDENKIVKAFDSEFGYLPFPIGRSSWDESVAKSILEDLYEPEQMRRLLHAGFGDNNRHFLELALENTHKFQRAQW